MEQSEWTELLKHVTFKNVLKTSVALFLVTIQILLIIWIVLWMSGNTHAANNQPEVTFTETVTTTETTETTPTTP